MNSEDLNSFGFAPGRRLAGKYEILQQLGSGWEGEVYRVREMHTGIERAAKFFYPRRNPRNRTVRFYARKLHKLRDCAILIQYYTQETIQVQRIPVTFLVSEYVEGEMLSAFLSRQPGRRLTPFQAVHLLYTLTTGMAKIHDHREYHGDLHTDNVLVRSFGLGFDLKVVDMFHWKAPRRENIQDDVVNLIHVFHEAVGGARYYRRQPEQVKQICLGLKRSLILKRFPTARRLSEYLETLRWA